jgi:REP element-mobilizing transposase RayT
MQHLGRIRFGEGMTTQRFRKATRLREYDYGQPGNYFFTICTAGRSCILGEIRAGEVQLSANGDIVQATWLSIPEHFSTVALDEMFIMPNHVHGIVYIGTDENGVPAGPGSTSSPRPRSANGPGKNTLGSIIGSFKSTSSRNINKLRNTPGSAVWQANYYEHIIRDEQSLDRIRAYIAGNPACWDDDEENPYRR